MPLGRVCLALVVAAVVSDGRICCSAEGNTASPVDDSPWRARTGSYDIDTQQVPTWSKDDLNFFLHGSMSTEVVPEAVLRAFIKTYPDLFPSWDLSNLGLIPDPAFGWPIGFSRRNVRHLGNLSAVGINCASCHVAQLESTSQSKPIEILGTTSHFDVEAFFGSVLVATFRTSDPTNMKRFLAYYVGATNNVTATTPKRLLIQRGKRKRRESSPR